jgi:hypothetical protein
MIDKNMMVLQSYSNSENIVVGPYGEQAMNIKAEEVSDAAEEEDPLQITVQEIKAEPEVSCMPLYVHCYTDNTDIQKCQLSF